MADEAVGGGYNPTSVNIACPFCKSATPYAEPACTSCGARMVKPCPYCDEEIQILARRCKLCDSDLVEGGDDSAPAIRTLRGSGQIAEEQNIVMDVVLSVVTCGLYTAYVIYRMGRDLNYHAGRQEVQPELDAVLYIVTAYLYGIWVAYRYSTLLNSIERAESVPAGDTLVISVVMAVVGMSWIGMLIIQDQMNRHWRLHMERPARTL